jgi:hypothetical protein
MACVGIMKKIDVFGRLENFFLCSFYPVLLFALLGILIIVDGLYFQNFSVLIRVAIFFIGVFFGAAFGYVLATVIFNHFFPRYCKILDGIFDDKRE